MSSPTFPFARRFEGVTGSAIRELLKLTQRPGMISFAGGNPAAAALEEGVIAGLAQQVLAQNGKAILQYGATEGYAPLRAQIAQWLPRYGFSPAPEDILPVTGSTQGIDLICRALINPGDVILVESPTYLAALQTMRLYEAKLVSVPTDAGGIRLDALEALIQQHRPKMLYVIPTFQNPTGVTLAAERRAKVAALAEKHQMLVLEDDPYRDLRYEGDALPAIKAFDQTGRVAHLSSFSKLIAPGLRVGALVAEPQLLRKAVIGKQSADVHTATLAQAIVAEYLAQGLLPAHIAEVCQRYGEQLSAMRQALAAWPEGTRYTAPQGGLFLWTQLPGGLSAAALLEKAIEHHVAFVPGTSFFCDGGHEDTLRLNFSNSTIDQIQTGMDTLNTLIKQMLGGN